jgi:hypothetical protein
MKDLDFQGVIQLVEYDEREGKVRPVLIDQAELFS